MEMWRQSGAAIHILDCSLPVRSPLDITDRAQALRDLVSAVEPDLIHSHFVTTTMMARLALGSDHPVPRLFQVPGPLHMEHLLYRSAELSAARAGDYWIASSRYIRRLYRASGVAADRVYLSYYGFRTGNIAAVSGPGRQTHLGIPSGARIVGNVNYMYPPKYYLAQTTGIKRHEDVIDALGIVGQDRQDVYGLLVGGQWGTGSSYERRLHRRANRVANDRIKFTGRVSPQDAFALWAEFDCAVHVPISENCGGVVEPLAHGVPTIASNVGGLPEVVLDGITGWLVPARSPKALAGSVLECLGDPAEARRRADAGRELVLQMFDVRRTGDEVARIYEHLLDRSLPWPDEFDSRQMV
jgi:glycosyltransferase involved in cell wall biosynthesis